MDVYRYQVTSVWGSMVERIAVGDVIRETQPQGSLADWTVMNLHTGKEVGGFSGKLIGRVEQHFETAAIKPTGNLSIRKNDEPA